MSEGASTYIGQLSDDRRWRWDGTAWKPVGISLPPWAGFKLRSQATVKALAGAAAVGLLADQAIRVGAVGLGATVTIAFAAIALQLAGDLRRLESRLLLATAAAFGLWLTARASPWLIGPYLAVALALLILADSVAVKSKLLSIRLAAVLARGSGTADKSV